MTVSPSLTTRVGQPLLDLVDQRAAVTPAADAVLFDGGALHYGDLLRASAALASTVRARVPVAGRIAGLLVQRSAQLPVSVLGLLRAGAAYLPLDPSYPRERLGFMLRDSGASVLVVQRELLARVDIPADLPVVVLDDADPVVWDGSAAGAPPESAAPVHDEDLAYVMYTSGSTGQPKGVAMPHRAVAALVRWQVAASACGSGARTLQLSPASFDASFQEMFATWAGGGCLVVVPEHVRRDPLRLLELIEREQVARVFLPFVALQALAETACRSQRFPTSLREVVSAGEALYATPAIRQLFLGCPDARLVNQYGPTETHIVTSGQLPDEPARWDDAPSIGTAIDSARVLVRRRDGMLAAPGVAGEVHIGGAALAQGYIGRPGLTADRFRPDPDGPPGSRAYRTGDLARTDADGSLHWMGRIDQQLKIRGFRVEPAEVETCLRRQPGCRDAVVVANAAPTGQRRLVAYVQADAASASRMREALALLLPDHLVPSVVLAVDGFPLTPSGKVDRAALAARTVELVGTGAGTGGEAEVLCRLWGDCAGARQVGPDDDFFSLGGSSLTAALLVQRLRTIFDAQVDLVDLHDCRTPRAMLGRLAARLGPLSDRTETSRPHDDEAWVLSLAADGALMDPTPDRGWGPPPSASTGFTASWYDRFDNAPARDLAKKQLELVRLRALVEPTALRRSLDIGSGTLRYPQLLARWGVDAVGIDVEDSGVRDRLPVAARRRFVQADGAQLPFADACFDLVTLAMGTIQHVPAPRRPDLFAEVARATAPGGRLVLSGWDPRCPFQAFLSIFSAAQVDDLRAALVPPGQLVGELRQVGFEDVVVTPFCIFADEDVPERDMATSQAAWLRALVRLDAAARARADPEFGQLYLISGSRRGSAAHEPEGGTPSVSGGGAS